MTRYRYSFALLAYFLLWLCCAKHERLRRKVGVLGFSQLLFPTEGFMTPYHFILYSARMLVRFSSAPQKLRVLPAHAPSSLLHSVSQSNATGGAAWIGVGYG